MIPSHTILMEQLSSPDLPGQREAAPQLPESPEARSRHLERSRLLPMVRRKLLIVKPVTILRNGDPSTISNVPAQFFVSESDDLSIQLADTEGKPIGTVTRAELARCAIEWNTRSVMKTTKPLPLYSTAMDVRGGRKEIGLLAPNTIIPVLERKMLKRDDGSVLEVQKLSLIHI